MALELVESLEAVDARGAPFQQGWAQGRAARDAVRAAVLCARSRAGLWGWPIALRRVARGPARAIARFVPQQHERLEGIAAAAGVSATSLALLDVTQRPRVTASAQDAVLAAVFECDLPPLVRRSSPDAGGFASVELVAPGWAGCLGGVNAEGVAVVCRGDRGAGVPSLRLLAQDVLFRCPSAGAALEHLRRRAGYLGARGALLLTDGSGEPRCVELSERGVCERSGADGAAGPPRQPALRVDAARRSLRLRDGAGRERAFSPEGDALTAPRGPGGSG